MIDEKVIVEVGRVIIASGTLEHSIRGYLSLAINDQFHDVGEAVVCKIRNIHDCIDLLETICKVRSFSKYKELSALRGKINSDKQTRNLLAHASFHEDSDGVGVFDVMTAYDIKKVSDIEKVSKGKPAITKFTPQRLRDLAKRIVGYEKELSELFAEGQFRAASRPTN
jgi:hypothetical protein